MSNTLTNEQIIKWLFDQGHATPSIKKVRNVEMVFYIKREPGKFSQQMSELRNVVEQRILNSQPKKRK